MYVRKKKVSPFISGAKCQGFGKAEDIFGSHRPASPEPVHDLSGFGQSIVDAETGEPLVLSTARWNVTEGRLNLDTATILAMGTGRLDIKKRAAAVEHQGNNILGTSAPPSPFTGASKLSRQSTEYPSPTPPQSMESQAQNAISAASPRLDHESRRHPLISQFLKSGPINPMSHVHWDPRTNSVLEEDEDGNPLDLAEEGVEYSSEEDSEDGNGSPGSLPNERLRAHSVTSAHRSATSSVSSGSHSKHPRGHKRHGKASGSVHSHESSAENSAVTKKSAASSVDPYKDTTLGVVDDSIVISNKRNWQAVEEKVFQELFALAWEYEHNKSLTKEEEAAGGLQAVRLQARELARMKVRGMRELVQANADEKAKEAKRTAQEIENVAKASYLVELQKVHEEERKKSRRYLKALEQENEIILVRKMADVGWLW